MKLFFAAGHNPKHCFEMGMKRRMMSFAYPQEIQQWLPIVQANNDIQNQDLILDSGAYTAWTKGTYIDIADYVRFVKIYKDLGWKSFNFANMDVIPGNYGRIPTPDEVEQSAYQGRENSLRIMEMGVKPIAIFHQGERVYWLKKMIEDGFDYVGISPANDRTTLQKRIWMDEMFRFMENYPQVKTHGFGVMAFTLLRRYPWYSCDAASWLQGPGYGKIIWFREDTGFLILNVSYEKRMRKRDHVFNYREPDRRAIIDRINELPGINTTLEEISTNYDLRIELSTLFILEAERWLNSIECKKEYLSGRTWHEDQSEGFFAEDAEE